MRAWYAAWIFSLFWVLSFLDRQIFAVLVTPIKKDLGLTDLQLSYIGGLSFVIFYVVFGLFMGRLADLYNRKYILWLGVALWTASTALCGAASRYWHLLVLRMGVGLGEAALAPCTFSMLADMFPRQRLATAVSICTAGAAVGLGLAYLGGAVALRWAEGLAGADGLVAVPLLGGVAPWRVVLIAVGLPGLVLSLVLLTVQEPPRRTVAGDLAEAGAPPVPLAEVLRYMSTHAAAFLCVFVGIGFVSLSVYAGGFWDIAFFQRSYGVPPAVSGVYYGLLAVVAQAAGNIGGGLVADWWTRRSGVDMKLRVLALASLGCMAFRLLYPLMPDFTTALVFAVPAIALNSLPYGVAGAAVQIMAPARMRGQLTAIYYFVQSLVGMGLGPTSVAFFTDRVFEDPARLGVSIALVGAGAQLIAAALFFLGLRAYQRTLADAARA